MSWIKDNTFLVALSGGTLLAVVGLWFWGSSSKKQYEANLEAYQSATSKVASFEKLALYPSDENIQAKRKALTEYKETAAGLQKSFEKYIPKDADNISSEQFTASVKAAEDEIRKAFEDAGTTCPQDFFVGFEKYKSNIVPPDITGVLKQELQVIRQNMLNLAASGATALLNLRREELKEEGNQNDPGQDATPARPFTYEVTFTGPEAAVRKVLSSITDAEENFQVIRVMRVTNSKKDVPKLKDAKFDSPSAGSAAPGGDAAFADGGFVLPGEDAASEPAQAAEPAPAEAPPVAASDDGSRTLGQILGSEQLTVFLRIEAMRFRPAQELP